MLMEQEAVASAEKAPESDIELGDEVAYLSRILAVQTEIGKVGLDIDEVMALVAERSQTLTEANGAIVELADGEEMVYRAGSGAAADHVGTRISAVPACRDSASGRARCSAPMRHGRTRGSTKRSAGASGSDR